MIDSVYKKKCWLYLTQWRYFESTQRHWWQWVDKTQRRVGLCRRWSMTDYPCPLLNISLQFYEILDFVHFLTRKDFEFQENPHIEIQFHLMLLNGSLCMFYGKLLHLVYLWKYRVKMLMKCIIYMHLEAIFCYNCFIHLIWIDKQYLLPMTFK